MTDDELKEIRARDANWYPVAGGTNANQACRDRRALLATVDELDRQLLEAREEAAMLRLDTRDFYVSFLSRT